MNATSSDTKTSPSMVKRMTLILDTFDGRSTRRSLEDVAAMTLLPRSTAHRILDQLVQIGWLRHDQSGYALGWRAGQLGASSNDVALLREVAAPILHELMMTTGRVVHFALLDGPYILYLDKIGGTALPAVPSRVGGRFLAHRTAVGKAMLSRCKPEEIDELLGDGVLSEGLRPEEIFSVQQELTRVRRTGVAFAGLDHPTKLRCIGAAVPVVFEGLQTGISICDGGVPANLDQFTPLLLDRVRRMSTRLSGMGTGRRDPVPASA